MTPQGTFAGLGATLVFLDLAENLLRNLPPGAFVAMESLEYLHLYNNRELASVHVGSFVGLAKLEVLWLSVSVVRQKPAFF